MECFGHAPPSECGFFSCIVLMLSIDGLHIKGASDETLAKMQILWQHLPAWNLSLSTQTFHNKFRLLEMIYHALLGL